MFRCISQIFQWICGSSSAPDNRHLSTNMLGQALAGKLELAKIWFHRGLYASRV